MQVGTYTQISVNWHGYESTFSPLYDKFVDASIGRENGLSEYIDASCPYEDGTVKSHPLMEPSTDPDDWDRSLHQLLMTFGRAPMGGRPWADSFFPDVAVPILQAHDAYKDGTAEDRFETSLRLLENCRASDWRVACSEWITRRWRRWTRDADGR
jgi:hypothetical protein